MANRQQPSTMPIHKYGQYEQPFSDFQFRWPIVSDIGEPNYQRRHGDETESVRSEPIQPGGQEWRSRVVKEVEPHRPANSRDCTRDSRRPEKADHIAHAAEAKT